MNFVKSFFRKAELSVSISKRPKRAGTFATILTVLTSSLLLHCGEPDMNAEEQKVTYHCRRKPYENDGSGNDLYKKVGANVELVKECGLLSVCNAEISACVPLRCKTEEVTFDCSTVNSRWQYSRPDDCKTDCNPSNNGRPVYYCALGTICTDDQHLSPSVGGSDTLSVTFDVDKSYLKFLKLTLFGRSTDVSQDVYVSIDELYREVSSSQRRVDVPNAVFCGPVTTSFNDLSYNGLNIAWDGKVVIGIRGQNGYGYTARTVWLSKMRVDFCYDDSRPIEVH